MSKRFFEIEGGRVVDVENDQLCYVLPLSEMDMETAHSYMQFLLKALNKEVDN